MCRRAVTVAVPCSQEACEDAARLYLISQEVLPSPRTAAVPLSLESALITASSRTIMSSPPPSNNFPPFSVVTDNDHSAWIIIATALGMACVLFFTAARTVFRYMTTSEFRLDDTLLVCSVVSDRAQWIPLVLRSDSCFYPRADSTGKFLAIIQSSVVLYGCSLGLGASMAHMTQETQTRIQKVDGPSTITRHQHKLTFGTRCTTRASSSGS